MTNKTFRFEFDMDSLSVIGESESGDSINNDSDDISLRIFDAVKKGFEDITAPFLSSFSELLNCDKVDDAYYVFEENKDRLPLSKDKVIYFNLKRLYSLVVDKNRKKELSSSILGLSLHFKMFDYIENDIELIYENHGDELKDEMKEILLFEKANVLFRKGSFNASTILFKELISNIKNKKLLGYIYGQLARVNGEYEDVKHYATLSIDNHLVCGNKKQAVNNMMLLFSIIAGKNPDEALNIIDKAINLYSSDNLLDREYLASLKHKKASLLIELNRSNVAYDLVVEICDLRRGLYGNLEGFHASLSLAELCCNKIKKHDEANRYKLEADSIISIIDDEEFLLSQELNEYLSNENEVIDQEFEKRILSSEYSNLKTSMFMAKALKPCYNIHSKLEFLDSALNIADHREGDLKAMVYYIMARVYYEEGFLTEAIKSYNTSLELNEFYYDAYQDLIAILFENELWNDAEIVLKKLIKINGEQPNICFTYARALEKNNKWIDAFKYFNKAKQYSSINIDVLDSHIQNCIQHFDNEELVESNKSIIVSDNQSISLNDFSLALDGFIESMSSDSRMQFWVADKEDTIKRYKWTKNPEEVSKHALITYLKGKFGKSCIELIQEPRAGAGFIDLYILLKGGLNIVVELKMCGEGYSSTYAISGESQILHYLRNTNSKVGFLVIFDSRKREFGTKFNDTIYIDNFYINTKVVDVRPFVDKK
ncbi:Predicted O-linked N-acetylglucosamine transferase%2C SPINDLY family [Yersinia enterocolitica]|uniref:tetratricopeptide repeat protein n=1 Tax=Yersinia mollaretii TaxID=33060 RepID=UPI0005EA436A|nr:hypothetical protein [Yersinia mollaretii]CNL37681.1 Predicted O-linked N-acetylglucosamine transferase%2C SPINDLY family [Yersinia enterocolitica]